VADAASYDGRTAASLSHLLDVPQLIVLDSTASTMDDAHRLASAGALAGTVVLADRQTSGRGRAGRRWASESGQGIWMTLIERPNDVAAVDVLSLRLGLRAARALDRFAESPVRLKWPNDLYVDDAKLAGILVEARWRANRVDWVAIGIGVNVRPPIDVEHAASLEGDHLSESLGTLVVTAAQGDGSTTLAIPAGRRDALRLHSATPLRDPPQLALGWVPDRLVFLPEGQAPYRLLAGSRVVSRPAWPIADALAGLRKQQPEGWRPTEASTGPGERLAGDDALAAPDAPFDWTRVILWVVLGLGVMVVGGMALSLLRKPPAGPREDP